MRNPRHAAAVPDHPRAVAVREDHLYAALAEFFGRRIFGPERAQIKTELATITTSTPARLRPP